MVSSVLKARLRDSLESLQKSIYAIKSEALMQKVEAEALLLREVNWTTVFSWCFVPGFDLVDIFYFIF